MFKQILDVWVKFKEPSWGHCLCSVPFDNKCKQRIAKPLSPWQLSRVEQNILVQSHPQTTVSTARFPGTDRTKPTPPAVLLRKLQNSGSERPQMGEFSKNKILLLWGGGSYLILQKCHRGTTMREVSPGGSLQFYYVFKCNNGRFPPRLSDGAFSK